MPNTYIRVGRRRKNDLQQRVPVPSWVDPFPWMQGSSIEKMVMAEFSRRGIYFQHSTVGNTVGGGVPAHWNPDILLPQYKIWLEIQGAYFHTLPGAVQDDALRFAIVEASGWKPMFWWEDDIRTRLIDIMNAVPEFYRPEASLQKGYKTTAGVNFFEGAAPDTLKGLRAALAGRAKPNQQLKVKRRRKRKKKYGS